MSKPGRTYFLSSLSLKILSFVGPIIIVIAALSGAHFWDTFAADTRDNTDFQDLLIRLGIIFCIVGTVLIPIIALICALLDKAHRNTFASIGIAAAALNMVTVVLAFLFGSA